jgi:hypothetical protein
MPKAPRRPKTPKTPRHIHATWARTRWCFRARLTIDGKRVEGQLRPTAPQAVEVWKRCAMALRLVPVFTAAAELPVILTPMTLGAASA